MTEPTIPLYPVMGCDTCKGVGPLMHTHEGGVIGTNAHLYRCRRCRTVVTLTLAQVLARVNARPPVRIAGSDPAPALAAFANVPADLAQAASDLVPDMQADVEPLPVAPVKLDEPAAAPAAAERLRCVLVLDGVTIGTLYATQAEADVLGEWASRTLARREELEAEIARLRATPARPDQVVDRTYLDQVVAAAPAAHRYEDGPAGPLDVEAVEKRMRARESATDEAIASACTESKLLDALSCIAVWEAARIVEMAREFDRTGVSTIGGNAAYNTQFSHCFRRVLAAFDDKPDLPALETVPDGVMGDSVTMCSSCSTLRDVPHTWRECLETYIAEAERMDQQFDQEHADLREAHEREVERLRERLELARIGRDEARDALAHATAKLPPGWAPFEKDSRIIDWLADPERYVYHLGNGLYTAHQKGMRLAVVDGVCDALPMLEAMQLALGLPTVEELWNAAQPGPCRRMDREPRVCRLFAGHVGACRPHLADELPPGWLIGKCECCFYFGHEESRCNVQRMRDGGFRWQRPGEKGVGTQPMHEAMRLARGLATVEELWTHTPLPASEAARLDLVGDVAAAIDDSLYFRRRDITPETAERFVVDDETVMISSIRWRRILAARHALPDGVGGPSLDQRELAALRQLHAWGQEEQATRLRLDELGKELAPLAGQLGSFTPKQTDMQVFCLRWINQVASLDVTVWGNPGGWSNGTCQRAAEPLSLAQQVEAVREGVEEGLAERRAAVKANEFAIAQFKNGAEVNHG